MRFLFVATSISLVTALAWTPVGAEAGSGGQVTATIDGKEFVWDMPTLGTESCTVFAGSFRVDFRSSKNATTIKMGRVVIEVGLEDEWVYSQQMVGPNKKKGTFTVEGKTVTYEGLLKHTPRKVTSGSTIEIVEVPASITATCP